MYAPLKPILPGDAPSDDGAASVIARIDALQTVLGAVARLAGRSSAAPNAGLVGQAELSVAVSLLEEPVRTRLARSLDTLGLALQAGLLALEAGRRAGRMSRAAAAMLHDECAHQLATECARARGETLR